MARQLYTYCNVLDEYWALDDRRSGISVGDLHDGTGNDRHFYHQNTLYRVYALTDETGAIAKAVQIYDAYWQPDRRFQNASTFN